MFSSEAMATILPNPKFSSPFLLYSRSFLPLFCSRLSVNIDGEKSVGTSSIFSSRQRKCGVTYTSRRRCRTSSRGAFILDNKEYDDKEAEEEEGEEEFVPLREMTRWLQNKPVGFGEGKTYDTAVEDNILEEMERSRKIQLEEKRKPRITATGNAGSIKKQEKHIVPDVIESEPKVRVGNLPKKKNIDRDLWKAFKQFPGITNISPSVRGNRKTTDPLCRGFAIIGFESNDAAFKFVQKYSQQNLQFGKVQKQISCDIFNGTSIAKFLNSCRGTTSLATAEHRNEISKPFTLEISEGDNGTRVAEQDKEDYTMLPTNHRALLLSANEATQIAMVFENSTIWSSVRSENEVTSKDLQLSSTASCDLNQKKIAIMKTKPTKSSKPRLVGPLARLKIKERNVFSGALSKYGEFDSRSKEA